MQQFQRHAHIMDICRRRFHVVHKAAIPVYADMRFVSKVPDIALFCLVCVWISLLVLVFGGGRRVDDRGVHNRPLLDNQTPVHQHAHDLRKKPLLQPTPNQQIAEPSQRIPNGDLVARIHRAKVRKGAAVYNPRHRAFVRQVEEVLQHINAKH